MQLDGNTPIILYGYGGYGISMAPYFSAMNRLWLDYGGAFAVANVRGGGEYGEPWHQAGMLTKKQNVFDDFAACMQFLVERKYTRPERLAIMGGSNGGLLMGATLTQHPSAMRAVVSEVGIYDSIRWETQPNGEFNLTEFGSVKDPLQFKALFDYSPLLRARRRRVSGCLADKRRQRWSSGALRIAQDGGAFAGCDFVQVPDFVAYRVGSWSRHRHRIVHANPGGNGRLHVPR